MGVENTGTIIGMSGYVVEAQFLYEKPRINDILYLDNDPNVKFQVHKTSKTGGFYCIVLGSLEGLHRGAKVVNSKEQLMIPVGNEVLGRAIDIFGDSKDGLGAIGSQLKQPIHKGVPAYENIVTSYEILETGIKVVDLFAPLIKGGKTGLFGGSGVGKTVLLTEILHNVINKDKEKNVSVFFVV